MGPLDHLDFTLRLFNDPTLNLCVQVLAHRESLESPTGIVAQTPVNYIPATCDIRKEIWSIADAIGFQGASGSTQQSMRWLGDQLRRLLFPPPIWKLFLTQLQRAMRRHAVLRLRLLIEPEWMAAWPYEYLYIVEWEQDTQTQQQILRQRGSIISEANLLEKGDAGSNENILIRIQSGFVALNPSISILRLSSLNNTGLSLAPTEVLRILLVYCNLQDDLPVNTHNNNIRWAYLDSLPSERDAILRALRPLEEQIPKLATVEVLENPTPTELLTRVAQGYHVLVYLGHAYYNANDVLGAGLSCGLVLDDGYSRHQYLEATRLAETLADTAVRLVVLNACETMREDNPNLYRGTAWALVEKGLTTIAMHFEQPDIAGLLLGDVFWRAVARQDPIDACLAQAREALVISLTENRPEWGNAALITQSPDGVILARPADIERASYRRYLENRFQSNFDDDLTDTPIHLALENGTEVRKLNEVLVAHPKLIVQARNIENISAKLMSWVLTSKSDGPLQTELLPIEIRMDRWPPYTSLPDFLSIRMGDLGLSPNFSGILWQHIRDGRAVLIFELSSVGDQFQKEVQRIADIASSIADKSPLLVVSKLGQNINELRKVGFTIANRLQAQDTVPPLKIGVWVEPVAFDQTRDILVEVPNKTLAHCRVGDAITINFSANDDCYLTLINHGSSGKIHTIFPNAYHTNQFVPAGAVYQIPDPIHGFIFRLGGPAGIERVQAIATREPVDGLHNFGVHRGSPFAQITMRDIEVLSKTTNIIPSTDRAEAECKIIVEL